MLGPYRGLGKNRIEKVDPGAIRAFGRDPQPGRYRKRERSDQQPVKDDRAIVRLLLRTPAPHSPPPNTNNCRSIAILPGSQSRSFGFG